MAAPFIFPKKRLPRGSRRAVNVCGRRYVEAAYQPTYALGIVCAGEPEQRLLFARLRKLLPKHDIKVLAI
jgi:hypothetical protein